MRHGRLIVLTTMVAAALALTGCHGKKKEVVKGPESGTTDGMPPDETTRIDGSADTDTPISGTALDGSQGPLKDIYFDYDRYDIRPDQRPTLETNARWLMGNSDQNVLVEGHCDERGTEEYNLALGDRRANSARDYLRQLGVPMSRMKAISYGEAYPVDPGQTEAAFALNRRGHFTVTPAKVGLLRPLD